VNRCGQERGSRRRWRRGDRAGGQETPGVRSSRRETVGRICQTLVVFSGPRCVAGRTPWSHPLAGGRDRRPGRRSWGWGAKETPGDRNSPHTPHIHGVVAHGPPGARRTPSLLAELSARRHAPGQRPRGAPAPSLVAVGLAYGCRRGRGAGRGVGRKGDAWRPELAHATHAVRRSGAPGARRTPSPSCPRASGATKTVVRSASTVARRSCGPVAPLLARAGGGGRKQDAWRPELAPHNARTGVPRKQKTLVRIAGALAPAATPNLREDTPRERSRDAPPSCRTSAAEVPGQR